ncbi:MAG: hypothetical protein FIB02_02060 [Desulfuromonas sp.]|nr:hypothetical protein [Desulfuromonas sp.]
MCHFITAVLPSSANINELSVIAGRNHRKLEPLENASVMAQLKRGEAYFLTTRGMCDCGTTLGYALRAADTKSLEPIHQVRKLRAKGWSEAKIARWLQAKEKAVEDKSRRGQFFDKECNADWYRFLMEILESGLADYVGLLLRWYSRPLSGKFALRSRVTVNLETAGVEVLSYLEDGILYEFSRGRFRSRVNSAGP